VPPGHLEAIVNPIAGEHFALAAFHHEFREPLGIVELAKDKGRPAFEIAVAVADVWQGQGLAKVMLRVLMDRARAGGLEAAWGLMSAENLRAAKLARRIGCRFTRVSEGVRADVSVEKVRALLKASGEV
jgi:acetyltransferase